MRIPMTIGALCVGLACAAQDVAARDRTETLEHDGETRTYHIHLPPAFDAKARHPLALVLHGGGGSGKQFARAAGPSLKRAGDARGFVLVFPDGLQRQWSDGRTEHLKDGANDDVGFLSKVIDRMVDGFGVDPDRVYSTGISNGGFMSIRLGLDLTAKLAAIAPVTAQITMPLKERSPTRPIAVMIVNGTKDPIVPYDGGHVRLFKRGRSRGEILSTAATVERFVRANRCGPEPTVRELPDKNRFDDARARVLTYAGGVANTEVVLVEVIGGGHTWPGGRGYLPKRVVGAVCRDFSASAMIFDFFLRHRRAPEPDPTPGR